MENTLSNDLESLWSRLLSRQDHLIREAFDELNATEQAAVRDHLRRMAGEAGWHAEQQKSARWALKALSID